MSSPALYQAISFHMVILVTAVCAMGSLPAEGKDNDAPYPKNSAFHGEHFRKANKNVLPRISIVGEYRRNPREVFNKHVEQMVKDKLKNALLEKEASANPARNMYPELMREATDFEKYQPNSEESIKHSNSYKPDELFETLGSTDSSESDMDSSEAIIHTVNSTEFNMEDIHTKKYPVPEDKIINDSISTSSDKYSTGEIKVSQCPTCERRNRDKKHRIESLTRQILKSIRITKMPNTTGVPRPKIPALMHLIDQEGGMLNDAPQKSHSRKHGHGGRYNDYEKDDDEDFVVKTDRVFTFARPSPMAERFNLSNTVYFSPPIHLYTSRIKTASLWFYIRKEDTNRSFITLTVERILPESRSDNRPILKTVHSQKMLRDKAFGWKKMDLRDILRRWLRHPMGNYGLILKATDDKGNNLIVLPPSEEGFKGYEPWLESRIIESRSNSRHRRSESLQCSENTTETRCCRYPLLVGFAEFGWDWIIAPTHVRADQCSGDCLLTMQGSPYGWVSQNVQGSSESCCTPTKMSPLSLLYFDENMNIVYQILQNIKVEKCGCV